MALTSSSFTTINIAYLFIFIWKYVHTQIVVFYVSYLFLFFNPFMQLFEIFVAKLMRYAIHDVSEKTNDITISL